MKLLEKYDSVVFVNIETTGLNETDAIIELAMLKYTKALRKWQRYDKYITLPSGMTLPSETARITGVTNDMLTNGIAPSMAAEHFAKTVAGKTLVIAYQAEWKLEKISHLFPSFADFEKATVTCDFLDALTVYKDRRPYPHKLYDAAISYGINETAATGCMRRLQTTATLVTRMQTEREDLSKYINIFGYNAKYGYEKKFPRFFHVVQPYDFMQYPVAPSQTAYGRIGI